MLPHQMQHLPTVRRGHHLRVIPLSSLSGPPYSSSLLFIAYVRNITQEALCDNECISSIFPLDEFSLCLSKQLLQSFGSMINIRSPYLEPAEHSCSHLTCAGHRGYLYSHCPSLAGAVLACWLQLGQAFSLVLEINC